VWCGSRRWTRAEAIRKVCQEASAVAALRWRHHLSTRFAPAKMWIALAQPGWTGRFAPHTQYNRGALGTRSTLIS